MEKKLFARYPLGNPRRKWRQDNFIMSVVIPGNVQWKNESETHLEKVRRATETAVEAGFNLIELLWASPKVGMEIVKTAERLEAHVIYQNLQRFGGMGYLDEPLNTDNDIVGVIRETSCWKSIVGYYVYDEPHDDEQRKAAREMIDVVERECPGKLAFTVSPPDFDFIDKLADDVDPAILSFDVYPFGNADQKLRPEDQLDHSIIWNSLEIARRASIRCGAPYGFYYQGQEIYYTPKFDHFTFAAARVMANAALLHGAKELSCYLDFNGVLDPETGGHGYNFEDQMALNEEVRKLGNTLMALECQRVIHDESVIMNDAEFSKWSLPSCTMEESRHLKGKLAHRISISELKDNYGHSYLMVLNRDYKAERHFQLELKEISRVYRISPKDGREHLAFDGENRILGNLKPGDLALYRIQPMDESPYTIEYYLEKRIL